MHLEHREEARTRVEGEGEKEGEAHGWRAHRRRLGKTDFQRAIEFEENEGKQWSF